MQGFIPKPIKMLPQNKRRKSPFNRGTKYSDIKLQQGLYDKNSVPLNFQYDWVNILSNLEGVYLELSFEILKNRMIEVYGEIPGYEEKEIVEEVKEEVKEETFVEEIEEEIKEEGIKIEDTDKYRELNKKRKTELVSIAKNKGIKNPNGMSKDALIKKMLEE